MPRLHANCAIAICIPITKDEFNACRTDPHGRELALGVSWRQYQTDIVDIFKRLRPKWKAAGVEIYTSVDLKLLEQIFTHQWDAVILISHWRNQTIELFDGMIDIERVTKAISPDFKGVLDLCVCNSADLAAEVRALRPNVPIKYSSIPADYPVWFRIYDVVIELYAQGQTSYLDALTTTLKEFISTDQYNENTGNH